MTKTAPFPKGRPLRRVTQTMQGSIWIVGLALISCAPKNDPESQPPPLAPSSLSRQAPSTEAKQTPPTPAPAASTATDTPPEASAPPEAEAPPYDLLQDLAERTERAKADLGETMGANVVENVFLVAAPNARSPRALQGISATVKTVLAAYFNGRFAKRPARAVSVYLFPDAKPYNAYCRRQWGEDCDSIYGFYLGNSRKIIMNLGPGVGTLTHELVHPIMETDFPKAPEWVNEGIASLYEGFALPRPGEIRGVKNWRYRGLMAALNSKKQRELVRLDRLFGMTDQEFRGDEEDLNYALARYVCMWLETKNLLWPFYQHFRDHVETDPTGVEAFITVVRMTPSEATPDWLRWVRRL